MDENFDLHMVSNGDRPNLAALLFASRPLTTKPTFDACIVAKWFYDFYNNISYRDSNGLCSLQYPRLPIKIGICSLTLCLHVYSVTTSTEELLSFLNFNSGHVLKKISNTIRTVVSVRVDDFVI